MKAVTHYFRIFLVTGLLVATAVWVAGAEALTVTTIPPTVSNIGPTTATVTWSTDASASPNHVWYGPAGVSLLNTTGLSGGLTVTAIDMYDSQRAFLTATCGVGCGRVYAGNRQTTGAYSWSMLLQTPYQLYAVAAENYNAVWIGGLSSSVSRVSVKTSAVTTSFNTGMTTIWNLDVKGGKVWAVGDSKNVVIYTIATTGLATNGTQLASVDPAQNRITEIKAIDANYAFAIADRYYLWTVDGGANWGALNPGTGQVIEDLKVMNATDALAVGRGGWVYRFNILNPTPNIVRPTTNDLLSLGVGSASKMIAFGCCSTGGKDYLFQSTDGASWSAMQELPTTLAVSVADFLSPTAGFFGGNSSQVQAYSPLYKNVATNNTQSTSHPTPLSTGLQEGVTYDAIADSAVPAGLPGPDLVDTAESGNFSFNTTKLDITDGPNVLPNTTTGTISWTTTLASDTRAYMSPAVAWDVDNGVTVSSYRSVSGNGASALAVGSVNNVLSRTTNFGSNWSTPYSPPNFAEDALLVGNMGWVVGNGFIAKSVDGTTWNGLSVPNYYYFSIDAWDPLHAVSVGGDLGTGKGKIVRTLDGGTTWQTVFETSSFLRSVKYVNATTLVVVGDTNAIYRSADGGATWASISSGVVSNFTDISMANDSVGWVTGSGGMVLRTNNGGASWTNAFTCTGVQLYAAAAVNPNEVWVSGSSKTLIRWTTSGCQTVAIPGISPSTNELRGLDWDGTNLWVAGDQGFIARYGIDTSSPQYHEVIRDTASPTTFHTTNPVSGLTPGTTYNYFVQSYAPSGASTLRSGTFDTLPVPTLEVSTNSLSFSMTEGGANPSSQNVQVRRQGGGDLGAWTATSSQPWLTVTPGSGGSTPGSIDIGINSAGLTAAGSPYTGTITVTAADGSVLSSPQTITVTLAVSAPPDLALSTTNLTFSAQEGSPNPAAQAVSISNAGAGTLTYTLTRTSGGTWLAYSSTGSSPFQAPNQVVVAPNITGLTAAGSPYTGTIRVDGGSPALNSPQTINVTLNITPAPTLEVTWGGQPAAIAFTATQSGPNPAPDTSASVRNSGGGSMAWTATTSASWLTVAPSSDGNGPTGLTIQAITGSLAPSGGSPYTATVNINAGAAGTAQIPVTFTVVAAPVLSATPTTLNFSTPQGTNPASQDVTITSGAAAGWSASVISGSPWLLLNGSTSGTSYPAALTVGAEVVTTGLAVGTYNGIVRISSPGSIPATVDIAVALQVTAPPVIQVLPSPPLTTFSTEEGKNPAPQTFTIDNIGGSATTMNWTISQPVDSWIRLTTTACTGGYPPTVVGANVEGNAATPVIACVDVTSPALLTPGSYSSSFNIVSPGTLGAPVNVNVSLTVLPDSTGPQMTAGSLSITTGFDCTVSPPSVFARVRWETNEYSDSQVYWGEQVVSGVPQYEQPAILRDPVDIAAHTGGVLQHEVLIDNLAGGHTYYVRFRSTDRYGNVGAFVDHDPNNAALFLSFQAPAACDSNPPTNVTLTVPAGSLYGTVNTNMSAQDESGIEHFELYQSFSGTPSNLLATISVPVGSCTSLGTTFSCLVTYGFATNLLPDGPNELILRAFDVVGNYADSPPVSVQIDNAVPVVSNILATPQNVAGVWQATITWDTDKPSTSRIDYGVEDPSDPFVAPDDYTASVAVDDSGRTDLTNGANQHSVTLYNLIGGQIYHFQVSSCIPSRPTACGH